ncbi:hypothetical protein HDU76_006798 [Blyttiomyces sp. JEL0837]|nr:hypothetical protein HDU76_006798 [Blyttiomyces sp. JEL0837]
MRRRILALSHLYNMPKPVAPMKNFTHPNKDMINEKRQKEHEVTVNLCELNIKRTEALHEKWLRDRDEYDKFETDTWKAVAIILMSDIETDPVYSKSRKTIFDTTAAYLRYYRGSFNSTGDVMSVTLLEGIKKVYTRAKWLAEIGLTVLITGNNDDIAGETRFICKNPTRLKGKTKEKNAKHEYFWGYHSHEQLANQKTSDCHELHTLKNSDIQFERKEFMHIIKGGTPHKYRSCSHQKGYQAKKATQMAKTKSQTDDDESKMEIDNDNDKTELDFHAVAYRSLLGMCHI